MTSSQDILVESEVLSEVRTWLENNWNANASLIEWRSKLAETGWGIPHWPTQFFGRGYSQSLANKIDAEFTRIGAIGAAQTGVRMLAAATLLEHGNTVQNQTYLRSIITGEASWCQLFSEPGSGSDLAGATTRADLDGDHWRINGQKVWTTSAHHADFGLLVARTDWDVPKHQGLSYFIIDMHQPGIEVRQLKQMNGHASFNEVFMTDAVVPRENLVSDIGNGWQVAVTTLAHERRSFGRNRGGEHLSKHTGPIYAEFRQELAVANEPYKWYPQRAGRVDLVLQRAIETGAIHDPVSRQDIARLLIMSNSAQWTAARARAAQQAGKPQGPEGSLGKLAASNIARLAARVHTDITGTQVLLSGDDSPLHGVIAEILISVPAVSIAGGTDEIQKNIISERVLGMPKEPRFDNGPFRDVPRNASSSKI